MFQSSFPDVVVHITLRQGGQSTTVEKRLIVEPEIVCAGGQWFPGASFDLDNDTPAIPLPAWVAVSEGESRDDLGLLAAEAIWYGINEGQKPSGDFCLMEDEEEGYRLNVAWLMENPERFPWVDGHA